MVCDMFDALSDSGRDYLLEGISKLALYLSNRIDNLVALQIDANTPPTTRYFRVHPRELLTLRPQEFYEILKSQHEHPSLYFSDSEITQIEGGFKAVKRACTSGTLPSRVDRKPFVDSWNPYGDRYSMLRRFSGGMATVFPGTSTVEADFSLLGNQETPERNSIPTLCLAE